MVGFERGKGVWAAIPIGYVPKMVVWVTTPFGGIFWQPCRDDFGHLSLFLNNKVTGKIGDIRSLETVTRLQNTLLGMM